MKTLKQIIQEEKQQKAQERAEEIEKFRESIKDSYESLESQIDRLAHFIMENIPGEPSESEGAIDTAIRLLKKAYGVSR